MARATQYSGAKSHEGRDTVHFTLILILAILGGLVGHHLAGGHRGSRGGLGPMTWYGVIAGAVVGLLLPIVFGIVIGLLHLVLILAVPIAIILLILAIVRAVR